MAKSTKHKNADAIETAAVSAADSAGNASTGAVRDEGIHIGADVPTAEHDDAAAIDPDAVPGLGGVGVGEDGDGGDEDGEGALAGASFPPERPVPGVKVVEGKVVAPTPPDSAPSAPSAPSVPSVATPPSAAPENAAGVIARIGPLNADAIEDEQLAAAADTMRARLEEIDAELAEIGDPIAWRDQPLRIREKMQLVYDDQVRKYKDAVAKLDDDSRARFPICQQRLADKARLEKEAAKIKRRMGK